MMDEERRYRANRIGIGMMMYAGFIFLAVWIYFLYSALIPSGLVVFIMGMLTCSFMWAPSVMVIVLTYHMLMKVYPRKQKNKLEKHVSESVDT